MTAQRKEFVTFFSPGTMFAETTTKPIPSRDTKLAVKMAAEVVERYGAKPYGFRFETRLVADPVPDGEGGTLQVAPKTVDESGTYHLGGALRTYDEIVARDDPREEILRSNMHGNGWWLVVIKTSTYKSTQPFEEKDFLLDSTGEIAERGNDPRHVQYRAACTLERKLAFEKEWSSRARG